MKLLKKALQNKHQIVSEFITKYISTNERLTFLDMNAGIGETFEVIHFFHPFKKYILNTNISNFVELRKKIKDVNASVSSNNSFLSTTDIDFAFLDLELFTLKHNKLIDHCFDFIGKSLPKYFMFIDHGSMFYRFKASKEVYQNTYDAPDYKSYISNWIKKFGNANYKFLKCQELKNKQAAVYLFKRNKEC